MISIVRSAGTGAGMNAMEKSSVTVAGAGDLESNTILSDRLPNEEVGRLNSQLVRSTNTLLKEATAPVVPAPQRGGGLWSAVMMASQKLAPAAALFLAADASKRRRSAKKTRKVRKGSRRSGRK